MARKIRFTGVQRLYVALCAKPLFVVFVHLGDNTLHPARIYRVDKRHLHLAPLRVLVFLDLDLHRHLIEHADRDLTASARCRNLDAVALRVELRLALEHHQALDAQPAPYSCQHIE